MIGDAHLIHNFLEKDFAALKDTAKDLVLSCAARYILGRNITQYAAATGPNPANANHNGHICLLKELRVQTLVSQVTAALYQLVIGAKTPFALIVNLGSNVSKI